MYTKMMYLQKTCFNFKTVTNQGKTNRTGYDVSFLSNKHKFKIIISLDQQAEKWSYRNHRSTKFLYKVGGVLQVCIWEFDALETSVYMWGVRTSAIGHTHVTNDITYAESGSKCFNTSMNCNQDAMKHGQKFKKCFKATMMN